MSSSLSIGDAFVRGLLFPRGPFAVSRLVVTVDVDTINACARWARTNVKEEMKKAPIQKPYRAP
jgi:hypothetical protein